MKFSPILRIFYIVFIHFSLSSFVHFCGERDWRNILIFSVRCFQLLLSSRACNNLANFINFALIIISLKIMKTSTKKMQNVDSKIYVYICIYIIVSISTIFFLGLGLFLDKF